MYDYVSWKVQYCSSEANVSVKRLVKLVTGRQPARLVKKSIRQSVSTVISQLVNTVELN